jgi:hypothetical protein
MVYDENDGTYNTVNENKPEPAFLAAVKFINKTTKRQAHSRNNKSLGIAANELQIRNWAKPHKMKRQKQQGYRETKNTEKQVCPYSSVIQV